MPQNLSATLPPTLSWENSYLDSQAWWVKKLRTWQTSRCRSFIRWPPIGSSAGLRLVESDGGCEKALRSVKVRTAINTAGRTPLDFLKRETEEAGSLEVLFCWLHPSITNSSVVINRASLSLFSYLYYNNSSSWVKIPWLSFVATILHEASKFLLLTLVSLLSESKAISLF